MKLSKLSYLPVLIACVLLLSGASESEKSLSETPSKPAVTKNEQSASDHKQPAPNDFKANKSQQAQDESKARIEHGPCAQANKGTNYPKGDAGQFWVWPPTSGWAVVYITAVYAFVALGQLWFIRRQANIARQALTTSERPWVGVGFEREYTLGNDFVDLRIYNSGKSPGHIKEIRLVGFEVVDKDVPISYRPQTAPPPGKGTAWSIFSGESTFQRWDVLLSVGEIAEVANKTKRLAIFGSVCYEDIFCDSHITNFCRVFMEGDEPVNGKFMIPPDAKPGQNEAT